MTQERPPSGPLSCRHRHSAVRFSPGLSRVLITHCLQPRWWRSPNSQSLQRSWPGWFLAKCQVIHGVGGDYGDVFHILAATGGWNLFYRGLNDITALAICIYSCLKRKWNLTLDTPLLKALLRFRLLYQLLYPFIYQMHWEIITTPNVVRQATGVGVLIA